MSLHQNIGNRLTAIAESPERTEQLLIRVRNIKIAAALGSAALGVAEILPPFVAVAGTAAFGLGAFAKQSYLRRLHGAMESSPANPILSPEQPDQIYHG